MPMPVKVSTAFLKLLIAVLRLPLPLFQTLSVVSVKFYYGCLVRFAKLLLVVVKLPIANKNLLTVDM
jgi:hypothetical protein